MQSHVKVGLSEVVSPFRHPHRLLGSLFQGTLFATCPVTAYDCNSPVAEVKEEKI